MGLSGNDRSPVVAAARLLLGLGAFCLGAVPVGAHSETGVTSFAMRSADRVLEIGHVALESAPFDIATIIVGDSAVATVNILDDRSLSMTATGLGRTNFIVMSEAGEVLEVSVAVVAGEPSGARIDEASPDVPAAGALFVYRGAERSVVDCDVQCLGGEWRRAN